MVVVVAAEGWHVVVQLGQGVKTKDAGPEGSADDVDVRAVGQHAKVVVRIGHGPHRLLLIGNVWFRNYFFVASMTCNIATTQYIVCFGLCGLFC